MKDEPKQMAKILETYLNELCEVLGIIEKDLPKQVIIYSNPREKYMAILSVKDRNIVKIGIKLVDAEYKVSGEFLTEQDRFPKTLSCISQVNGGTAA